MAAVRSEGGLLPADVLARISALDRELGGLGAPAFHLAPNERIGEAVARSWARLSAAWEVFSSERDLMPAGDHSSKATRERWLLPLFSELGYGRLIQQPGVEVDGKSYAVFCEYNHCPIHLVGAAVPLDRRTAGVRGAAEQSPHSLVQELLNRSTARLWGVVTNGLTLRLLRDNVTLTRQAYVEFDLEAIFATEAYEDFALLWLCAHQSRIEAETPEECWLEQWTQAAQRDGTRALGELRSGVERAIEALGRGFLGQPANAALHDALRDGRLDGLGYYRELLRLIYRLLFLFVAEDRNALLLPDDATAERHDARERYDAFYGTRRLRRLAVRRRGGRAHDLYEQLKLLSGWLHDGGQPVLALPPLGSALWNPETTEHISYARLGNEALLEAIRELSYVEGGRRPVDFRNLGAEELGSVYESLLELHPEIDRQTASFALTTAAGHERKQTGSYYTPKSLIGSLLETALDPVIDRAARSDDPERALLDLSVCDPACGSGHFLIAAANRIAKRLAAVREQDPEPAPEAVRHAVRDVVSRCIHGVDLNPMAVELCKVSLWMEALEPGRPLSFLDHRIVLGNSLLGATPTLLADGIPQAAFRPLQGDDRQVATALRKRNANERAGQRELALIDTLQSARALSELAEWVDAPGDATLPAVREREQRYGRLLESDEHERARLVADLWCTAFIQPKQAGTPAVTQSVFERAAQAGEAALGEVDRALWGIPGRMGFLHWHVAFPHIFRIDEENRGPNGWSGGFDVVLGNPPWERVKLQEQEFFAARHADIATAPNKAARERLIGSLEDDDPALLAEWRAAQRDAEGASRLIRDSGRYPLCGRGDVNTYAVFAETNRAIIGAVGRVGCVVPTGIATDDTTKHFFQDIIERRSLASLYDFKNNDSLFYDVGHRRAHFSLLTLCGPEAPVDEAMFVFSADRAEHLAEPGRRFTLTAEDIGLLNPNTRTCPIFRSARDAELTKAIYRRVPVLIREGDPDGNPWDVSFTAMLHMANDSGLFRTAEQLTSDGWALAGNVFVRDGWRMLPLHEAKMLHHFDHRYGDYAMRAEGSRDTQLPDVPLEHLDDPAYVPLPRYWVDEAEVRSRLAGRWDRRWLLGWRDITNATNERTVIAALLPRVGVGHTMPLVFSGGSSPALLAALVAVLSSFACDYVARQKIGGTHLTYGFLNQLAVPTPSGLMAVPSFSAEGVSLTAWLMPRILELTLTAHDLGPLARDLGYDGPPFRWDPDRRAFLRAEMDAAFFHLYGIARDDVDYILDTFPIVRRNDERAHGEYRTKRAILETYDAMARAAAAGTTYETPLDPPPGAAAQIHAGPLRPVTYDHAAPDPRSLT